MIARGNFVPGNIVCTNSAHWATLFEVVSVDGQMIEIENKKNGKLCWIHEDKALGCKEHQLEYHNKVGEEYASVDYSIGVFKRQRVHDMVKRLRNVGLDFKYNWNSSFLTTDFTFYAKNKVLDEINLRMEKL